MNLHQSIPYIKIYGHQTYISSKYTPKIFNKSGIRVCIIQINEEVRRRQGLLESRASIIPPFNGRDVVCFYGHITLFLVDRTKVKLLLR